MCICRYNYLSPSCRIILDIQSNILISVNNIFINCWVIAAIRVFNSAYDVIENTKYSHTSRSFRLQSFVRPICRHSSGGNIYHNHSENRGKAEIFFQPVFYSHIYHPLGFFTFIEWLLLFYNTIISYKINILFLSLLSPFAAYPETPPLPPRQTGCGGTEKKRAVSF